jgi:hypothetical protein
VGLPTACSHHSYHSGSTRIQRNTRPKNRLCVLPLTSIALLFSSTLICGGRSVTYQVKIRAAAEREALIRGAVRANTQRQDFYDFRSQKTELPVVRIPEDALMYRMENFRTFIEQREYILREKRAGNFFLTGQESETVQQLQHDILAKLAARGVADSVVPVMDVLRADKQREPLLITFRGVVINGNRRLAGMRELYDEDSQSFSSFSHITCLVLPEDATPDEIVDIEAALQAKPETRLDYDWIGDCQLIQRLLETHKNIDLVAARLNRKPTEIKNSLAALNEAGLYLRDWAKKEGEYSRVVDAEQLFKDLPARLEGKSPELLEASRVIAWNLFDRRADLKERLYAFNVAFGKRAADVLDRMATDLNVDLKVMQDNGPSADDFDVDLEAPSEGEISYKPVIDALKDPRRKEEATETLIDVCRNIVEAERGVKGGTAALRSLTQISSRIRDVDIGSSDPTTHAAIDKQLTDIITRASGLRSILQRLSGS